MIEVQMAHGKERTSYLIAVQKACEFASSEPLYGRYAESVFLCRMMNLIRASKNKSVNKIVNAYLITEKYGYTVEFLAQSAWSCQEHNLKIAGRPSPE
jgi:hypothetical protein